MILSVFESQKALMDAFHWLYLREPFQVDVTYGKGALHKGHLRPDRCFDISPRFDFVEKADCTALPFFRGGEVHSIAFDPPFLAGGGDSGLMNRAYGSYKTVPELLAFYDEALREFYRVLAPGGLLLFKCQDINNGRTQGFSHCEIYNMALDAGLYALDLFVLVNRNRMKPHKMKHQNHARKAHCYFWVFEKSGKHNHRRKRK